MTVILSDAAKRQLKKLNKPIRERISKYIDEVASLANPRARGKGLSGNLSEYWSYRVGDYRIVCRIQDNVLQIEVVKVGHRRDVYDS